MIPLILTLLCQPVSPPAFWTPASAAVFTPSSIAGMAYYWDYTDLPVDATTGVLSWVDRIQSIVLTNGDHARLPTNAASGAGVYFKFTATTSLQKTLTNVTQTVPNVANHVFAIWVVFASEQRNTWQQVFGNKAATQGDYVSNGNKGAHYPQGTLCFDNVANVYYDWVIQNDQGGGGFSKTNTVATGAIANTATDWSFNVVGTDDSNEALGGWIKFIGVWTNVILTAAQVTNLYTYSSTH